MLLLGFLFGDSNDRFLDKVSGTYVVMDVEEPYSNQLELILIILLDNIL